MGSGYEPISDQVIQLAPEDSDDSSGGSYCRHCHRLRAWWYEQSFWHQVLLGGSITLLVAILLTIFVVVFDNPSSYGDRYTRTLAQVPPGCLGPPFLLVSFHGGQSHYELNLKTGRFNSILKYTRDGCLLGQATESISENRQRVRRLRGLRVLGDSLYVVDMGSSAVDNVGTVAEFGSCGSASDMVRRPIVHRDLMANFGSENCRRHLFGVDSPDGGATLYVSDQVASTVSAFYRSSGRPIQTANSSFDNQEAQCNGVVADWSAGGKPGYGMRGFGFNGDDLLLPYDSYKDIGTPAELHGIFVNGIGGDLKLCNNTEKSYLLNKNTSESSLSGLTAVATPTGPTAEPNRNQLRLDVHDASGPLDMYAGATSSKHVNGFGSVHKPSVAHMHGTKLYFNTRLSGNKKGSGNGAVELDLVTKQLRPMIHHSIGYSQDVQVHEDVVYVLTRRETKPTPEGTVDTRRRAVSWRTNSGPPRGDIVRFDLNTGDMLGGIISDLSVSAQFPDQPVQMELSMC